MPEDKNQNLDDIITDMNIETISLDDVELTDFEDPQPAASEPFLSGNLSSQEVSFEPAKSSFIESNEQISIPNLDSIQNTPEPEIPSENPMEFDESIRKESSIYSKREDMDVLNKLFTSEDDIISIEGSELDKLIYGDLSGDLIYKAPTYTPSEEENSMPAVQKPEMKANIIDDIPVLEEAPLEEEIPATLDEPVLEENLIPAMDMGIEDIKLSEEPSLNKDFNFDLSAIPDVSQVEEDEPIALSLDELNKIDISAGVVDYSAPQVPLSVEPALEAGEDENVEISLDELNKIEADLTQSDKISPDAYVFESPEAIEEKENIIEEKIDPLSASSKEDLKKVLQYIDKLLENLPEDKIKEFAKSEYYDLYSKILNKLGI